MVVKWLFIRKLFYSGKKPLPSGNTIINFMEMITQKRFPRILSINQNVLLIIWDVFFRAIETRPEVCLRKGPIYTSRCLLSVAC